MSNWKEEFDDKFPFLVSIGDAHKEKDIKKFISDLRKHDQEKLIKMFEERDGDNRQSIEYIKDFYNN